MSSLELRVSETLRGRGDCFSPPKEMARSKWLGESAQRDQPGLISTSKDTVNYALIDDSRFD